MKSEYLVNLEEDEEDNDLEYKAFKLNRKQDVKTTYTIHLADTISSKASDYFDLIGQLYNFDSDDSVVITLGGNGGDVARMSELYNAISSCPAHVTCFVHGRCYSAHAVLALAGDVLAMQKNTYLMFHHFSGGFYGKGGEVRQHSDEFYEYFKRIMTDFCYPFLTKAELNRIFNDKDVYVREWDKDLSKRTERFFKK